MKIEAQLVELTAWRGEVRKLLSETQGLNDDLRDIIRLLASQVRVWLRSAAWRFRTSISKK